MTGCNGDVQDFEMTNATGRYIKVTLVNYWGQSGSGLQYVGWCRDEEQCQDIQPGISKRFWKIIELLPL